MPATLFAAEPTHPHVIRFRLPQANARDLDLDEAFRQLKLPELRGRSPETIGEYRTHLRRWRECFDDLRARMAAAGESWKYRMLYPVLPEIGRTELRIYRDWLSSQLSRSGAPLFSARTINKHLGSVKAVLRAADEEDLIPKAPSLKPLPTSRSGRKLWLTHDQVDCWMDACEVAAWPRGLTHPAPDYWRALGVMFCIYGFRTQEIVAYESSKAPLDLSQLSWAPETPHPEGHAVCPWGWFTYTPVKQQRLKPEPLVLPLTETAHRWLRAIADNRTAGPVFPFPLNNDAFYATWHAIVRRAELQAKPGLDGSVQKFLPLHMRKTAVTWLNDHGARIGCPGIAELIVGHGDDRSPDALVAAAGARSKVQQIHYDCAENRILETLLTLPVPESFNRLKPDPQQRLF